MVPFAPRLIPVILPNLAHHVGGIQSAALQTNRNLFSVIESLPPPSPSQTPPSTQPQPAQANHTGSSTSSNRAVPATPPPGDGQLLPFPRSNQQQSDNKLDVSTPTPTRTQTPLPKSVRDRPAPSASPEITPDGTTSRPQSPTAHLVIPKSVPTSAGGPNPLQRQDTITASNVANLTSLRQSSSQPQSQIQGAAPVQDGHASTVSLYLSFPSEEAEPDPFDYQATVSGLMVQFLSEYVETRVAALKWLLMLHLKAPKKVLFCLWCSIVNKAHQHFVDSHHGRGRWYFPGTIENFIRSIRRGTALQAKPLPVHLFFSFFQVIKYDLQLLAQISSSSDDIYFKAFLINLLQLFSTDRRLLETRGSLIIRQLCLTLNTERIFRTFAEILEKEEASNIQGCYFPRVVGNEIYQDLEFASFMVQRLNVILTTSPELGDFRKRLRNIESRVRRLAPCCSNQLCSPVILGRASSFHCPIPIMVSQPSGSFLPLSLGASL
jgi:vacuole morphology and inheritance protein 14